MKQTLFSLLGSLVMLTLFAACTGSNDQATAPDTENILEFETDVDALRKIYPIGDLEIESVRWRLHTDFVTTVEGGSRLIDDLPAQDADPILEAIFVFEDDSVREALLAGRTTTLSDIPKWYPSELADNDNLTIAVATADVDGLPGTVAVFPDVAPFVRVSYQP